MKQLLFISLITLFISCKKEEEPPLPSATYGKATFYLSPMGGGGSFRLVVDGVDKGELAQSASVPQCEESGFITLTLLVGSHTHELKDIQGTSFYKTTFYIAKDQCTVRKVH